MQRCLGCMRAFGEEFDVCPHCGYIVGTGAASKNYLEPGTVLQNRYTLGKVLGQGGFGITYIAWDNKIGKAVAVKEYMPNAFASRVPGEKSVSCYNTQALAEFRTGLEKTRRETRTLARFNELESVVKVYDCFEENDTAYIVMELLRGKTVKEILTERERLSFDETMRIMTPVLQTLDSMHSVGMIHRDVAPDNIFVCEDGKIKLLDFGAARVTSTSNEKTLSVILKQGYAPKEQYSGRGNQGAWTDVYAVCATMYRMLTGTTLPDSLSRTEDAAPDVAIPDSAKNALRKGLAVEPEKRTQSAGELLRELQKDLPQSSYAIDPRQFLDFEEKQKKRKRLRILLAAVAAILLLAAVAVAVVTAIQKPNATEPSETETGNLLQTEEQLLDKQKQKSYPKIVAYQDNIMFSDFILDESVKGYRIYYMNGNLFSFDERTKKSELLYSSKTIDSVAFDGDTVYFAERTNGSDYWKNTESKIFKLTLKDKNLSFVTSARSPSIIYYDDEQLIFLAGNEINDTFKEWNINVLNLNQSERPLSTLAKLGNTHPGCVKYGNGHIVYTTDVRTYDDSNSTLWAYDIATHASTILSHDIFVYGKAIETTEDRVFYKTANGIVSCSYDGEIKEHHSLNYGDKNNLYAWGKDQAVFRTIIEDHERITEYRYYIYNMKEKKSIELKRVPAALIREKKQDESSLDLLNTLSLYEDSFVKDGVVYTSSIENGQIKLFTFNNDGTLNVKRSTKLDVTPTLFDISDSGVYYIYENKIHYVEF